MNISGGTDRECSMCKTVLPNTNEYFNINKKNKDGSILLKSKCRSCIGILDYKRFHSEEGAEEV